MNKILRAGLIGIGAMGRGHLSNFVRFNEEGNLIKLVAICDVDESRFGKKDGTLNISGVSLAAIPTLTICLQKSSLTLFRLYFRHICITMLQLNVLTADSMYFVKSLWP